MIRIGVTDDWLGVAARCADWSSLDAETVFFGEPFPSEEAAVAALADFDAIVPMRERLAFPRSLLARLPRLKLLALTGFQAPHVDLACCAEQGITICGSGAYSPTATAELTLGLMLATMRDLAAGDRAVREGRFQRGLALGDTLEGKTLGIVGLGRVGARVAAYGAALGMRVVAWSPNLTDDRAAAGGAIRIDKGALFANADIVSIHLAYAPPTHGIVDAASIAAMKPGALLVNTARAALVDTAALIAALRAGRIRAALDVFDEEPLMLSDPLLSVPGTLLAPHLGFSSRPGFPLFYEQSVENIRAFLAGSPIRVMAKAA